MKKQSIKYISSVLTVFTCMAMVPQKASAQSLFYFANIEKSSKSLNFYSLRDNGTGIFNSENLKYLSSEQKKQLKEYQEYKDMGKKLSDEQQRNLDSIVDCVTKAKLGDEKYKDYKSLTDKLKSGTKLTNDENKKLKEYKKIMNNCDDCSNSELLKQFLR